MGKHIIFDGDGKSVGWCECWVGEAHLAPSEVVLVSGNLDLPPFLGDDDGDT